MKKLFLALLIFNFQFSIFNSLRAQDFYDSNEFGYSFKDEGVVISSAPQNITATDLVIPDSVDYQGTSYPIIGIAMSVFEEQDYIKTVKIGNCVKSMEEMAFYGCDALESVTCGDSLQNISTLAFCECKSLTHVDLRNVWGIASLAFSYCTSLRTLIIPASLQYLDMCAFQDGCRDITLSLPYDSRERLTRTLVLSSENDDLIPESQIIERNPVEQDVNNDGHINSGDVVTIYNYIIDPDATGIHPFRADTNLDGDVNSGDVVDIYNAIINDKPVKPIDPVDPPTPPADTLPYPFSVSNAKTVSFSKGNLQYVGGKWQFASKQYEYFGTDQSSDHKDMFPFNGYTCPEGWYCLTNSEWTYLLSQRTVSNTLSDGALYTLATLGDTYKGMIVFPDTYTHPDGTGFTAGTYNTFSNYTATVSLEGWALMEKAGAMFLPCAGYKSRGETWKGVGTQGCYMTTTATGGNYYDPWFDPNFVSLTETSYQSTWSSVRLVK